MGLASRALALLRKPSTVSQQILFALIGLNMLVTVLFAVSFYERQKAALFADMDSTLCAVATLARETLPPDYHDRITGPDSVSDGEFQKIVDRNNRLCVALGLEYIWSLMQVDGRIVFTSSTSPDKVAGNRKHAKFFELHSNPELYIPTFESMRPTYRSNVDKWGRIRVCLLPFTDAHGRKYLFGSSFRQEDVERHLQGIVWQSVGLSVLLFGVSMVVGLWLTRRITRPIREMTSTIQGVAAGGRDLVAPEYGSREQVILARQFNLMNRALQEKISELEAARVRLIELHDEERRKAEEDLVVRERRYRGLLNFAVDGILVGNYDGIIIEANECVCNLFGLPREEIVGKHLREMPFTPESVERTPFQFGRVWGGETVLSERTIRRRDGSEVVVEIHTKMMADRTLQSIYHDVTQRKRAEKELHESEERYRKLFEMESDAIFLIDCASLRFLDANPAAEMLYGYQREVILTMGPAEVSAEFERSKSIILGNLKNGNSHLRVPFVSHKNKDGTVFPVEITGRYFTIKGNEVLLVAVRDITERKQTEESLKEAQQLLKEAQRIARLGGWQYDLATHHIVWTEEMYHLFGVGVDSDLNDIHRAARLFAPEHAPIIRDAFRRACESGEAFDLDVECVRTTGERFWVHMSARAVVEDGQVVRVNGNCFDISDRKRAQDLLKSWNAALERQVAERTAEAERRASQLRALTERLVRVEEDERQRISDVLHENLQQILVAARMALGMSIRAAAGEPAAALKRVDGMLEQAFHLTRTLVREIGVPAVKEGELPAAIQWAAQQAQEKFGLAVDLKTDEDLQPVDKNVYLCVYRAVQEIFFNIVKHANVMQAEVSVRRADSRFVRVSVTDKGAGIAELLPAEAGRAGKGVGLYSIRERIEGLGGSVEVVSGRGAGTTVVLIVPVMDSASIPGRPPSFLR